MQLLDNLFSLVKQNNASDLHCGEEYKPHLRIDGDLVEQSQHSVLKKGDMDDIAKTLLNKEQIKKLQGYNDIDFSFTHENARYRGHAYHEQNHLNFAFRSLPLKVPSAESLGISGRLIEELTTKSEGLFLVTGATGSGKSTTIAALIDIFNQNYPVHIITIEDPVEYIYEKKRALIKQREVGRYDGDVKSFSVALRSALREDPDIIFVGEMRDMATTRLALRAAETGHLVFSTLHTHSTSQIPNRIISMFSASEQQHVRSQLAHSLRGAIAQRLLPRADGNGRVAAHEIMFVNPAIRSMIIEGKLQGIQDTIKTSRSEGMMLLEDAVNELKANGIIE